ncbi:MAG: hypothetical protein MUE73_10440 [Planctomycetes bacterium]|jgi:hypothetical protein|nr:hypothetical protein [Planctomycetota bacterium]
MSIRTAAFLSVMVLVAGLSGAAQLVEVGPGGKLAGAESGELPVTLAPDQQVEGPAVVEMADGSRIRLGEGGVLRMLAPEEEGREEVFVSAGSAVAEIGGTTELVLPLGRVAGPKEGRATVYVEVQGRDAVLLKVTGGRALVVQGASPYPFHHFLLTSGQSLLLTRVPGKPDAVDFDTLPYNTSVMAIIARVTSPLEIVLSAPRATIARIEQIENGAKTKVTTDPASQGGQMEIVTFRDGMQSQKGVLGPGTFAIIDNLTGEITFEEEEIDYGAVARTISLTSEFQVLALSNFNTIKKKNSSPAKR